MVQRKGKRGKRAKDEENYVPKAFRKNKKIEENKEIENPTKKKNKKSKKQPQKSKFRKAILVLCLAIIIIIGIALGISAHRWKTLAQEMLINENSIVIDIDGKEIAKLGCERKSETIALPNMPENLKNAYVAIEDERFYSHGGIDIKRTGRCYCFLYFSFWKFFLWRKYNYATISKKFDR